MEDNNPVLPGAALLQPVGLLENIDHQGLDMSDRMMALTAFLQAQNCSNLPASWRHAETDGSYMSAAYYQNIARTLEHGKFHLAFFDDRLAMPDVYGNGHGATVESGIRTVKLDPVSVLTAMGMATSRLGLGSTYSTTYYEPFHVARVFATHTSDPPRHRLAAKKFS